MAKKTKKSFFCQHCGYESLKWLGKCPACEEWNTFVEEIISKEESKNDRKQWISSQSTQIANKPVRLEEVTFEQADRFLTADGELNRVLGGGIVPGSMVLIGGEPGIGKSTLMLQLALSLGDQKLLYVSGEESEQQIRMRADRLKQKGGNVYILNETATQNIFKQIEELQPEVVVIDSIQTLHTAYVESAPGSVSQVRECTGELLRFAKETSTPVFVVGHITKDGTIAGPKVLEHMVDTVLQFEGDRHMAYRLLRTIKNRFGSTSELGIYEMNAQGLREVKNPSEILLSDRSHQHSGVSIAANMEGNRTLLVEVQALVAPATYGTPQRSSNGYDPKRLGMLLAVIEKRCGFRMGAQDVFLNIAGGIRVEDPAVDLSVCMAVVSSLHDLSIGTEICFAAEIGLGGELRAVSRIENRIFEAQKLGFREFYLSSLNMKGLQQLNYEILLRPFDKIQDVFQKLI